MTKQNISPWKKLLDVLKLEKKDILQVLYYALFTGLISLTLPLGIQAIINMLQGAQVSTSWILLTVLVTIGVGFVGALQVLQLDIVENIQEKIFARASFEFVHKIPKIRVRELEKRYPPELANRFFDVLTLQKGLQKLLLDFPAAVIQIFFGLILLSLYHAFFIAFGIALVILMYIIFKFTLTKAVNSSILESKKKYHIAFWIQQVAANFKIFKIYPDEYEQNKNNELVESYLKERQSHFGIVKNQFKQMVLFKVIVTLGLLLIGGLLVLNQQMNIGQFVAAEIIIVMVINSVEKIGFSLETIYDVVTAVEKISEVSDQKLDRKSNGNGHTAQLFPLRIEDLKIWNYKAKDIIVTRNMAINVVTNQVVTNSLFQYMSGMKRTKKGKIFFNHEEISNINLDEYRNKIALVLNSDQVFEGTVWENISLSNPKMDQNTVYELAQKFNILEEIQALPNTLSTYIFPGYKKLSDNSIRKICLLRALLKKPHILMIEEGFITTKNDKEALLNYVNDNNICLFLGSQSPLTGPFETLSLTKS
ncbi:ABC transporter transmembrane domain-containing protein [Zunongwangia sp.]|uniref:ABC transporter transmembrane domain-containing protein n=1 Tax=Zunongwangia sp. TaxID=1965325 RepID=UPI003AA86DC4